MKKVTNVPPLRFPGFEEEWETKKLGEIADKITDGTHNTPKPIEEGVPFLTAIHIKDGFIDYENCYYLEQEVHNNIYKRCNAEKGDLLIVNIGAGTATCALNIVDYEFSLKNVALVKPNKSIIDGRFLAQVQRKNSTKIFNQLTSGGAQPFLSLKEIGRLPIKFPFLPEQKKISSFLSLIDERISTQNKIIEELKLLKNTIRYQLYEQILNQENEYVKVKDTLNYEQPTKYLVTNTDYSSDISLIPVLTANKAFVLGYTDEEFGIYDKGQCIIFDDFTMDIKFVDFLFKVKSSAIKILAAKPNVNLKFIFEYLLFLNLSSNEHKRHYISEIEPLEIQLPNYIQQTYVADFLSSIDDKVKTEFEIHMLLIKQKQYLLANLFI